MFNLKKVVFMSKGTTVMSLILFLTNKAGFIVNPTLPVHVTVFYKHDDDMLTHDYLTQFNVQCEL